jgi:hypothetical protein
LVNYFSLFITWTVLNIFVYFCLQDVVNIPEQK